MAKLKLLVTDKIDNSGLEPLIPFFDIEFHIGLKTPELNKIIGNYHSIITRTSTPMPKETIENARELKIIARAAIGVDNIDITAATAHKIAVINAPKGNARSTAEHTIGLIIALLRHIPQATADLKNGIWGKTKYVGVQFRGKTLGIVGYGNVGREVYRMAKGLGMEVIVCEPYIRIPKNVRHVTYEELLKESDIITFHVPSTYLTKSMLNKHTLKLCKKGVYIINCSRGAVVDEKALISVLPTDKVAGVAMDVFVKEPQVSKELLSFPNVIATPHIAGSTVESQKQSVTEVVNGILQYLKNSASMNLLNPQVFTKIKTAPRTRKLEFDSVIFDCDSTLSTIEGIDELAALHGLKKEVAILTKKAMEGELHFEEVYHQRLNMIKPHREDLEKLGDIYVQNLAEDAKETVEALQYLGKNIYLVSSGYTKALLKMAQFLKIPDKNLFANDLIFNLDGTYRTYIEGPLKRNHGKLQIIRQIPGKKVAIGDGITDLETKELLDLFIGYGGKERRKIVELESDIFIYCKSLTPVLILAAGIDGCLKLLSTKYKKYVGKGLDLLSHPKQTRINKMRKYNLYEYKKLAYF